MTRKVKNIRKGRLMAFLLMVAIAALVYIINSGNHHIFETEYDDELFKPLE